MIDLYSMKLFDKFCDALDCDISDIIDYKKENS